MRVKYTESFPIATDETEAVFRMIRKVVDDRLAEEILKRLQQERKSNIA